MAVVCDDVSYASRLQRIEVSYPRGQCHFLLGANGAGKSSLLSIIGGIAIPSSGRCLLQGQLTTQWSLAGLSAWRCLHMQSNAVAFDITVGELLQFYAKPSACAVVLPDLLANALDIDHLLSRPMLQLSGGEAQRVHLARTLLQVWPMAENGQALLLFDEPLQGLDINHQLKFCALMKTLSERGNCVIMSVHDLPFTIEFADTVTLLNEGQLLAYGDTHTTLNKARLKAMFACDFVLERDQNKRIERIVPVPLPNLC